MSVLIATRHRPDRLAETLRGLAAMRTDGLHWQLVVVDNGGDGRTREVVASAALPVSLVVEAAPGKNRALNRGLDVVAGSLVVFTDDDVRVDGGWLAEVVAGADRWPAASMFGGRILPEWPEGEEVPPYHPFFDHAYGIADFAHGEGPYSPGYVYGGNMAVRAALFHSGWRFDERLGPDGGDRYVTGSETSLTVALARQGHTAVYLPRALVHHQIRPEQLSPAWLYGRAFRRGRADALKQGLRGGWRRIPPALVTRAARAYAAWSASRLRGDRAGTLDHGLAYWNARGMMHQCRVTRGADAATGPA